MIHEDGTLTDAPPAARQPEPPKPPVENAGLVVQYVDDEIFRRSLERVATLHERLLAKLSE